MILRVIVFVVFMIPALLAAQPPSYKPMIDSSADCNPTKGHFFMVEEMPSILNPIPELENMIQQKVLLTDEERDVDSELYIQCMVNCQGDPGDYQLTKCPDELSEAGNQIVEVFRNGSIKWKPGIQGGVKVDVFMILKAGIKNGNIKITVVKP